MKKYLLPLVFACSLTVFGCSSNNYNQDEVPDVSASTLYKSAANFMASGDYQRAKLYLEAIDSRYPFGSLSEQVQLDLIYVYYKSRDTDLTQAQINRFIRLSPTSQYMDYVLYMKGLNAIQKRSNMLQEFIGLDRSQKDPTEYFEAFKIFNQLIETYPDSPYAKDARQRMIFIKEELAKREMIIAKYYAQRGAYLSSARHCQTILYSYKDTSYLKEALTMLKDNYIKLNLKEPADNVQKVIDASFK